MDASQEASRNHGAALTVPKVERELPLRAMRVTLEGRDIAAMPIIEALGNLSGHYHAVEGVVDFTPVADHHYAVVGNVWARTRHRSGSRTAIPMRP